jgi:hypothetical protein
VEQRAVEDRVEPAVVARERRDVVLEERRVGQASLLRGLGRRGNCGGCQVDADDGMPLRGEGKRRFGDAAAISSDMAPNLIDRRSPA